MNELSDIELLNLYHKSGKVDYLGILFKRYTKILLGVSLKYTSDIHDAEDVVQQVFIKFLEQTPPNIQNVGGYLFFMTKNESLNFLKKSSNKYHYQPIGGEFEVKDENELELNILLEKEGHAQLLQNAIDSLKEDQRNAINSFYFHKKSYEEVAQQFNWTVGEVKSHIQNAKRNLKIKLENHLKTH